MGSPSKIKTRLSQSLDLNLLGFTAAQKKMEKSYTQHKERQHRIAEGGRSPSRILAHMSCHRSSSRHGWNARVVTIKVKNSELKRNINKIALLPIYQDRVGVMFRAAMQLLNSAQRTVILVVEFCLKNTSSCSH